jgi:hypothetical protein
LFASIAEREGIEAAGLRRMAATAALLRRRLGRHRAVALFLAGPGANNITGVELRVDAGQLIQG